MTNQFRRFAPLAVFVAAAALSSPVAAQSPSGVESPGPGGGLPTAPAADRAAEGGLSASAASLPGPGNGASPLEPYLVTWLLPVSGLLSAIVAIGIDRRVRSAKHG
jgi:hypothetical protein